MCRPVTREFGCQTDDNIIITYKTPEARIEPEEEVMKVDTGPEAKETESTKTINHSQMNGDCKHGWNLKRKSMEEVKSDMNGHENGVHDLHAKKEKTGSNDVLHNDELLSQLKLALDNLNNS